MRQSPRIPRIHNIPVTRENASSSSSANIKTGKNKRHSGKKISTESQEIAMDLDSTISTSDDKRYYYENYYLFI